MESGETAEIEEMGRLFQRRRLLELAEKGELYRSVAEYHEYQKLLELWRQGKI